MTPSDGVSLAQWTLAGLSPFIGYACARLEKRGKIRRGWGLTVALLTFMVPQFALMVLYFILKVRN